MDGEAWDLLAIGDFIYLLDCRNSSEATILQRRFKKDRVALEILYDLLERLDGLGFEGALSFGLQTKRLKPISNNKHLQLIEIRVGKTLWRVITVVDRKHKALVMIDAFQHHKKKTMNQMVNESESRIRAALRLLEEADLDGNED